MDSLPTSFDVLARDLDSNLDNLTHLLTNPNFVSLEEVVVRDEEIERLRVGWSKMELRLAEAFALMQSWRERIASGGDTIHLEELKKGLDLGIGLETTSKGDTSLLTGDEEAEDDGLDEPSSEDVDEADAAEQPKLEAHAVPTGEGRSKMNSQLPSHAPALKECSGNIPSPAKSPRKVAFSASVTDSPPGISAEGIKAADLDLDEAENGGAAAEPVKALPKRAGRDGRTTSSQDGSRRKRTSSAHAHPHPEERSAKLTVHDKLSMAQAEAEASVVKGDTGLSSVPAGGEGQATTRQKRGEGKVGSQARMRQERGRGRGRQSTLTPAELEELLLAR